MYRERYDVIVIGTGPGGEGAAMKCTMEGKEVAVIDDFDLPGGNCTHRGTIPSKALSHAVQQFCQHNLQLPHHGRGLSRCRAEWVESGVGEAIGS